MNYLDPKTTVFADTGKGFLQVTAGDGTVYNKVSCTALFPLSLADTYISVSGIKTEKPKEIGIIRKLSELPADQRKLVEEDIQLRYFAPEITDIIRITVQYGMEEWEVKTNRGDKTFFVRNLKESTSIRDDILIMITDIEKCRYLVPDYRRLPARARGLLEQELL